VTALLAERVAAFRSEHKIHVLEEEHPDFGRIYRCELDGLRVHPMRDGRWRHDSDEVITLLNDEYGGAWGMPRVLETTIERIAAMADRDDDGPDFDYEGSPEFNGSFR